VVEARIHGVDPGTIVEAHSRPCHHPIRAASGGFSRREDDDVDAVA
jgi:hypothetical protein